jgi:hypothetical protein
LTQKYLLNTVLPFGEIGLFGFTPEEIREWKSTVETAEDKPLQREGDDKLKQEVIVERDYMVYAPRPLYVPDRLSPLCIANENLPYNEQTRSYTIQRSLFLKILREEIWNLCNEIDGLSGGFDSAPPIPLPWHKAHRILETQSEYEIVFATLCELDVNDEENQLDFEDPSARDISVKGILREVHDKKWYKEHNPLQWDSLRIVAGEAPETTDGKIFDTDWLSVRDAAQYYQQQIGKSVKLESAQSMISRACKEGKIISIGFRKKRRISLDSLARYTLETRNRIDGRQDRNDPVEEAHNLTRFMTGLKNSEKKLQ